MSLFRKERTQSVRLKDLAKIDQQVAEKHVFKWILRDIDHTELNIKPSLVEFTHSDALNQNFL